MSEAHARAWWADVEHLREAAERRSAERAKARIEGRAPVALTPLQPLHAVDGLAAFDEALDDVQPLALGEAPSSRRFARDGAAEAVAFAAPERGPAPRTGTLTLVRVDDAPDDVSEARTADVHLDVDHHDADDPFERVRFSREPELRPVRFTRRRGDDGVSPRPRLR